MGLLNVYNNRNKVTNKALVVDYELEPIDDNGHDRFLCTRTAKKSYEYIGMDYGTSIKCANKLRKLYTHEFWRETNLSGHLSGQIAYNCPSGIQPTRGDGCMWGVDIDVNEMDQIVSDSKLSTMQQFEELFAPAVSSRQYDEDVVVRSELTLWGVTRFIDENNNQWVKIDVDDNIPGDDKSKIVLLQTNNDPSKFPSPTWTQVFVDATTGFYNAAQQYNMPYWIKVRNWGATATSNIIYLAPKEFD